MFVECDVDAWPAPSIKILRSKGTILNDRFKMVTKTVGSGMFKTTLTISNVQAEDSDVYSCSAENIHGSKTGMNWIYA